MSTRTRFTLVALAAVAALAAGCGPSFTVVKQATPNPLTGVKSYAFAPVAWDGLTWNGKPEAEWLATRTAEQKASWENDKAKSTAKMMERFQAEKKDDEQIVAAPGDAKYVIAVHVKSYDDGIFHWNFEVRDASGQVIDEVVGPPRGGGFGIAMELNALQVFAPVDILKYLRSRYEP